MRISFSVLFASCLIFSVSCFAQETEINVSKKDSTPVETKFKITKDTIHKHSPRTAAIRSAILPGLGQIYNKKYWKLPIVYGALGTCAGVFVYNLQWYKRTRFAYTTLATNDVANFPNVHPKLQFLINRNDQSTLQYLRNQYRRDIDYSVLFFLLLWGLNVIDATVDAHLKSFDVSPDLSLQFKPGRSELAGTNGLSVVLKIGK
ncbi:hypothetical protein CAP36_13465 [Chitinophagaceae bacterium IBVUCB2]|nr:hypothetical protein CAP36_13465 [Chitinophagaceae bacterium IBVUCB2]